jgi:hypothetical protein
MVNISYEIINQIKEASDDSHVKIIIENSFQKLNVKKINGFSARRRFMMNMVMALRYVKAEGLHPKASQNVSTAIEIIEQLRKQEYSNLF